MQPVADLEQQGVARFVAERVVDRLEAIEVDQHQRALRAGGADFGEPVLEQLADEAPVGQPGQRVVACGMVELDVGFGDAVAAALHGAEGEQPDREDRERGKDADQPDQLQSFHALPRRREIGVALELVGLEAGDPQLLVRGVEAGRHQRGAGRGGMLRPSSSRRLKAAKWRNAVAGSPSRK